MENREHFLILISWSLAIGGLTNRILLSCWNSSNTLTPDVQKWLKIVLVGQGKVPWPGNVSRQSNTCFTSMLYFAFQLMDGWSATIHQQQNNFIQRLKSSVLRVLSLVWSNLVYINTVVIRVHVKVVNKCLHLLCFLQFCYMCSTIVELQNQSLSGKQYHHTCWLQFLDYSFSCKLNFRIDLIAVKFDRSWVKTMDKLWV